jgi:hypothetical protein
MNTMIRKQLYLTPAQDRALKERARREKRSEAAVLREAVNLLLTAEPRESPADDALRSFVEQVATAFPTAPQASRGWSRDDLYDERESR